MTKYLRKAVEVIVSQLPNKPKNVLEIGSKQERGQEKIANLRSLFNGVEYIGIDMRKGMGVDIVASAENLPFDRESFNLIICLETLEHAEKPWLISQEINRTLKKSGTLIISSQQNYPLHKHPSDYFRYTPYGLSSLFDFLKEKLICSISPPFCDEVKMNPQAVILVGWKQKEALLKKRLIRELKKRKSEISGHKPYRHRLQDGFRYFKRGMMEIFYKQEIEFFNI